MKIKESQLRNFIRQQIKEMAYAGRLSPPPGRSDDFSEIAVDAFDYGPYEDQKKLKPDIVSKYAMSQTFERLAKKHFANIPWNVWFAPLIGTYREIVTDSNEATRATLEPLYPNGITRLKSLGYEVPENIGTDDVVILYTSTILEKDVIATPWMIVHSMFDNIGVENFSKTFANKIFPIIYSEDNVYPGTEALSPNVGDFFDWKDALTMRSVRTGQIGDLNDVFAEIMCQELLTRNGFTINENGIYQEYIDALYALKSIIKQCAREFNSNIRGKLIITSVN